MTSKGFQPDEQEPKTILPERHVKTIFINKGRMKCLPFIPWIFYQPEVIELNEFLLKDR